MRVAPALLGLMAVTAAVVAGTGNGSTAPEAASVPSAPASSGPTPTPSPTPSKAPAKSAAELEADRKFSADLDAATRRGVLEQNQLYSAGRIPRIRCPLPGGSLATRAALLGYMRAAEACMTRAWRPLVQPINAGFEAPKVLLFDREGKPVSTCGMPPDVSAFYCGDDKSILFEAGDWLEEDGIDREYLRVGVLEVMAHEYGHHVQDQVAILAFGAELDAIQTTDRRRIAIEERMELQASCLGAAFLGANQRTFRLTGDRLDSWEDFAFEGDETHGTDENNAYWTGRAFASGDPKSCNTWSAPARRVS